MITVLTRSSNCFVFLKIYKVSKIHSFSQEIPQNGIFYQYLLILMVFTQQEGFFAHKIPKKAQKCNSGLFTRFGMVSCIARTINHMTFASNLV